MCVRCWVLFIAYLGTYLSLFLTLIDSYMNSFDALILSAEGKLRFAVCTQRVDQNLLKNSLTDAQMWFVTI